MPPPAAPAGVGRMGLAGGAGGTAGVTAPGDEVPGCGAIDATASGFVAVTAVGLRAGALRAAGFRAAVWLAGGCPFCRSRVRRSFFLGAGLSRCGLARARFLRAGAPRASTFRRLPARCTFLPTRSRSHGFCSDLLCCRSRPLDTSLNEFNFTGSGLPTSRRVNCFFIIR